MTYHATKWEPFLPMEKNNNSHLKYQHSQIFSSYILVHLTAMWMILFMDHIEASSQQGSQSCINLVQCSQIFDNSNYYISNIYVHRFSLMLPNNK